MRNSSSSSRLVRVGLDACSVRIGRHWALQHATFELRAGERWLLLGANGAGKTVLLKLIRGDLWPTPTGSERRTYTFADGHVDQQPLFASARIAYLGPERQDRYERYESRLTVAQVVLTGFDDSDFPLERATRAQQRAIERALQRVGLRGLRDRRLTTLSYGQRRRVLLARAIVRGADVLLLDEALNGLDAAGRVAFARALRRAVPPRTAWILSTHRRVDEVEDQTTHVARIVAGRIVEAGPWRTDRTSRPGRGTSRPRLSRTTARVGSPGSVRKILAGQAAAQLDAHASSLVRLEGVAIYRDGRAVLGTFDWTLKPGEHWMLRGPNGSGKSTLMALLYGDLWPKHGGRLERRWVAAEDWKRRVGLLSPELQAAYAATGCTVHDIVASGLHDSIGLNELPTPAERLRVERELSRWPALGRLADRRARELSYGQLRLALAARAFVRRRRLYLFDEPCDGLDAEAQLQVWARLAREIRAGAATLVVSSHHEEDVPPWVKRQLTLRRGRPPRESARSRGS